MTDSETEPAPGPMRRERAWGRAAAGACADLAGLALWLTGVYLVLAWSAWLGSMLGTITDALCSPPAPRRLGAHLAGWTSAPWTWTGLGEAGVVFLILGRRLLALAHRVRGVRDADRRWFAPGSLLPVGPAPARRGPPDAPPVAGG